MTSKKPTKSPPDEDPAQSQRFLETARELEAAGDLNLTENGGDALDHVFKKLVPIRKRSPPRA